MWSRSVDWFIFLQTWINLICSYNLKIRTTKGSVQWGYLSLEREINCLSLSEQEIVCKILLRQMHVLYIFKYTFKISLWLTQILFPKDSHKKFWSCYLRRLFSEVESLTKHQKKALLAVLNHNVVFANWAWEVNDISVAGIEECVTCISYHGVTLSFSVLDSTSLQ